AVVLDRQRVDQADPRKRQPVLLREVRDRLGLAERPRMRPAGQEACIEETRDVAGADRPVRKPPAVDLDLDLDERLEPVEAPRAVADDLALRPAATPHRARLP